MKFKFRLQKVLELREREEREAQIQYQQARALTVKALDDLELMYQKIDQSRLFSQQNLNDQGNNISAVFQTSNDFERLQLIRIQRQREMIRELKQVEEQKQDILVDRTVKRKALEKLREKALADFKERVRKLDDKALDDLVSGRHSRGFGLNSTDRDL